MTQTKIRWGILATGAIAATFTEDLLTLDDAEVVAVGSRSLDTARAFADRYGIPRAHGSWAELAADPTSTSSTSPRRTPPTTRRRPCAWTRGRRCCARSR